MDFVKAHDLAEALAELAERGDELTVLAGGTDVMVQILRGDLAPAGLLCIRMIQTLRGITAEDRTLLGALTTHRELLSHPHVQSEHPGLAEAAATIGGRQTQNMGTIAGNVVNASPAADLMPPLLVADAVVNLESAKGGRALALTDFLLDRKLTARAPWELIAAISLARPGPRTGEVYLKLGAWGGNGDRGVPDGAIVG